MGIPASQPTPSPKSIRRRVKESIRFRFGLLLLVLIGVFGASLGLLKYMERFEYEDAVEQERASKAELLRRLIALKGHSLEQFANDYSQWDEMVAFSKEPSEAWALTNIVVSLENFQANAIWIFSKEGKLVYRAGSGLPDHLSLPEFTAEQLSEQFPQEPRKALFILNEGHLWECRVTHLRSSSDVSRRGQPLGWLVVVRLWDKAYLDSLAMLAQGSLSVQAEAPDLVNRARNEAFVVAQPLSFHEEAPVAWLRFDGRSSSLNSSLEHDNVQMFLFIGFALISMGIIGYAIKVWIIQPLLMISACLQTGELKGLVAIEADHGELGQVAELVRTSFEGREALIHEVEVRTRTEESLLASQNLMRDLVDARAALARNLHDGVIQTLYAAGMGVGGVMPLLRRNPDAAQAQLEQARVLLNEVIRDLRNFIEGLDPEAHRGTFEEVLQRLAGHMQSLGRFRLELKIEPSALEDLSLAERAHFLYIAREAMSNALRHGQASVISVALVEEAAGILFTVTDNGVGLPVEGVRSGALGLLNMECRARDMGADFSLLPGLGSGTVLRIWIPFEPLK